MTIKNKVERILNDNEEQEQQNPQEQATEMLAEKIRSINEHQENQEQALKTVSSQVENHQEALQAVADELNAIRKEMQTEGKERDDYVKAGEAVARINGVKKQMASLKEAQEKHDRDQEERIKIVEEVIEQNTENLNDLGNAVNKLILVIEELHDKQTEEADSHTEEETSEGEGEFELYQCEKCGEPTISKKGLNSHLYYTHDTTLKKSDLEEVSELVFKGSREEVEEVKEDIKESQAEVEEEITAGINEDETIEERKQNLEDIIRELKPEWFEGKKLDISEVDTDTRKLIAEYILIDEEQALTRGGISQRLFNLEEEPEFGDTPYNVMQNLTNDLVKSGVAKEADTTSGRGSKAYVHSSSDAPKLSSRTEQQRNSYETEDEEENNGTEYQMAVNRLDSTKANGKRMMKSLVNAFQKGIVKTGVNQFSYYDFESSYGGELQPLDAWRKMYANPSVLKAIESKALPESDLSWQGTGEGRKPQNWVLNVN